MCNYRVANIFEHKCIYQLAKDDVGEMTLTWQIEPCASTFEIGISHANPVSTN